MPSPAGETAPARILLVDDRPENLLALEAILVLARARRWSGRRSGEEALKALLADDYAVILLDVQMPGMDGFETAAHIKRRERTRDIPIIFLTAINREPQHAFRGYSAGAVDYLAKPFDPWVLRAKVGGVRRAVPQEPPAPGAGRPAGRPGRRAWATPRWSRTWPGTWPRSRRTWTATAASLDRRRAGRRGGRPAGPGRVAALGLTRIPSSGAFAQPSGGETCRNAPLDGGGGCDTRGLGAV